MEVKTRLFGTQAVDPTTVITFPQGIPGFEENKKYKLFHQEGGSIVYWLQSLDEETLNFSVAESTNFNINYSFVLTDEEQSLLGLDNASDLLVLIMLHKEEGQNNPEKPQIKGSLKAPLIINIKTRIGMQKVLQEVEQTITFVEKQSEIEVSET